MASYKSGRLEPSARDPFRIIDANLNRLREGLRSVEEHYRFLGDSERLAGRVKAMRHSVGATTAKYIPPDALIMSRDSGSDVGRRIRSRSEGERESAEDVLASNLKRCQEAARALEEFSKLVSPKAAKCFKEVRYELYVLEQDSFKARLTDFRLYLLAPGSEGVAEAVRGGVGLVQFRDKSSSDGVKLKKIDALMRVTRKAKVPLIINDRPDLCLAAGAAGVHLGQDDMDVRTARRMLGPGRMIGISAHSLKQALMADRNGPDYLAIGPVFATGSKGPPAEPIGTDVVRQVVRRVRSPVVAIGGITADNIGEVLGAGVRRVAVIGAILGGGNPYSNARNLRIAMERRTRERGS